MHLFFIFSWLMMISTFCLANDDSHNVQGLKQGCTYPVRVGMLSGIPNRRVIFFKDVRISGYFDTQYMAVL